ncbi:hypothetical protein ACGFZB_28590 [Streptomyces cinerochromogenes]|uniref:Minor tail protein n=1 Tax=Streptomyces cinerochromogenes TaxID=66422 RepID=A0ABW7BEG9_9ACTN
MSVPTNLLSANAEGVETDISPWNAGSNTTLQWSTRFYTGSHSLGMTAVATGTVTATLANRVAVTAGVTYQAYAYFAAVTAGAGRTATVRIDWYSASVGGTAISSSSGSVALDATTAWNTPPPQVTAQAPSGAQYASLTVTVSGVSAGQQMCADRFTLGLPFKSAVNLLPYTASSVETDATEWTAEANTALSRTQPTAREGWYSLVLTSSAAGQMGATSVAVPVTPGTNYMGQAYAQSGSGSIRLNLRWYDSTGALISTTTGPSWALSSSAWTTCNTGGTAPAGAATARLVLAPTATAAGQTWTCDIMAVHDLTTVYPADNLIPFLASDFEAGIDPGWAVTGGTASLSTASVYYNTYSMAVVADGGDLSISLTTPVTGPIVAGQSYQLKAPLSVPSGGLPFATKIEWLDSTGSPLRTRWQTWTPGTGSGWYIGPMGDIAPAGAVSVRVAVTYSGLAAGTTVYIDRVQLIPGGLTVAAVPAGGGGVALTVNGLTTVSPTWTWSLVRLDSSGKSAPVRGWTGDLTNQTITGDNAVVTDYETPLGVPVVWRLTVKDPGGVGWQSYTSDPVTLDAPTTDVWLKDPGLPARSVQLTVATPMPTWSRSARQGVNQVRGRQLPVIISDVRSGKTGTLTVVTETDDERAALDWVLSSGNTLLLQWPPGWGEEDIYVSVGDVQLSPVVDYAEFHDRTWSLPLTQVDRPIGGVTGSADRTWQTVKDAGASWLDALAGAESWLDVYTGEAA